MYLSDYNISELREIVEAKEVSDMADIKALKPNAHLTGDDLCP
jgi:hypothetical protein